MDVEKDHVPTEVRLLHQAISMGEVAGSKAERNKGMTIGISTVLFLRSGKQWVRKGSLAGCYAEDTT